MTTIATNQSELAAWNGTGTLQIGANFSITSAFTTINLAMTGTVNIVGGNHIITIDSGVTTWNGLFKVQNSSTSTINCSGVNLIFSGATVIQNDKGGIFADAGGTTGYNLNISLCSVEGTSFQLNSSAGGICGRRIYATIDNCYVKGGSTRNNNGYICGNDYKGPSISNCFSTGNISNFSGGIVFMCEDPIIYNCYSLGTIAANCGGIAYFTSNSKIYNCYSVGTIDGGGIAIILYNSTMKNCYSLGTVNNAGLSETLITSTVQNCYSLQATGNGYGTGKCFVNDNGGNTITNVGYGNTSTWPGTSVLTDNFLVNILTDGPTTYSDIWASSDGTSPPPGSYTEPFLLTSFTTYPWAHTTYNSIERFDIAIPCVVKGASILTDKGYIKIENLKVNDKISTNEGYKSVFKIGTGYLDIKDAKGELLKAKKGFYLTLRHSFLIPESEDLEQHLNAVYYSKTEDITNSYKIKGYNKVPAVYCYPSLCDVIDENELLAYNNNDSRIQYFHVVVRDTNKNKNFGMYINETLVETLSIDDYNEGKIY